MLVKNINNSHELSSFSDAIKSSLKDALFRANYIAFASSVSLVRLTERGEEGYLNMYIQIQLHVRTYYSSTISCFSVRVILMEMVSANHRHETNLKRVVLAACDTRYWRKHKDQAKKM